MKSKWPNNLLVLSLCLLTSLSCAETLDPNLQRAIDLYTGAAGKVDEKAAGQALLQANQNDPLVKGWVARAFYMGPTMQHWGLSLDVGEVTKAATNALPELRRLADGGSAEALYLVGIAAKSGFGRQPEVVEGAKWLRRAADQGHVDALFLLGMDYYGGRSGVVGDMAEAINLLEKAAAAHHAWADAHLGYMYQSGDGIAQDGLKAITLIQKSALKGNSWGQFDLGEAYRTGQGVVQDLATAIVWYQKSAAQNLSRAQKALEQYEAQVSLDALKRAKAEIDGIRQFQAAEAEPTTPSEATPEAILFQRESRPQMVLPELSTSHRTGISRQMLGQDMQDAAAGKAGAQMAVGIAYLIGDGVLRDIGTGMGWLQKAARQNHAGAEYFIGEVYLTGMEIQGLGAAFSPGVTQNLEEAIKWFRRSAEKGHTTASINLGYAYATGLGVARDPAQAVQWYRKPAGYHSTAQFNLGLAYDEGSGIDQNQSEGLNWYLKSAAIGFAPAQNNVGYAYSVGRGVRKNPEEAMRWFRKAAEQTNGLAQLNLGVCYAHGIGVAKDEAVAAQWYRKAAANGVTGNKPTSLDADMKFAGGFGLIFKGQWTIETVAGGSARDFEEFPAAKYPDREIANRRVKFVANAADSIALPGPTHVEYWTRNGMLLTYLISSSRIYGENTPNGTTATNFEVVTSERITPAKDDETLYVDKSLAERYKALRLRHQGWTLQDFGDHISKTNLQDLENFMRKWDSQSPAHKQMLANLTKFIQRTAPVDN